MKNKKFDPFKNLVLDEYEQEIEDALGKGEYVSDPNFKETKKMFEDAAKNHIALLQSKSVTIRVNQGDLTKVKAKAKKSNIAYQTVINLLINKYASGEVKLEL